MEPLNIPKGKNWKGLNVFCYKCKTNVKDICKETGKPIKQCPFGDRHAFKIYAHVPGSDNQRKTITLETRDVNIAIQHAITFEKEVKEGKFRGSKKELKNKINDEEKSIENRPEILIHCCAKFMAWLKNENVPTHLARTRSEEYIEDIETAIKNLLAGLKENEYNLATLKITDIDDRMVGKVYDYLLTTKEYSNRTFNKQISYLRRLFSWYVEEYNVPLRSTFSKVKQRKTNPNPQAISEKEYNDLLNIISPDLGIVEYHTGVKPYRNFYRTYLKDAIRLGMLTGRRRQEIISMKFSDIVTDSDALSFIRVEDYKVNHIQARHLEEEKKFVLIPITKELHELLMELGLEQYKGTDEYIFAPGIKNKRTKTLLNEITRGFTHYYGLLGTGRKLTFKSMRKTYISALSLHLGGNAKSITGHSNDSVIEKYYLNKEMLVKAASNFQVFNKESERMNSIDKMRSESETKKEIGIEK